MRSEGDLHAISLFSNHETLPSLTHNGNDSGDDEEKGDGHHNH